jgi:hypothetical protein
MELKMNMILMHCLRDFQNFDRIFLPATLRDENFNRIFLHGHSGTKTSAEFHFTDIPGHHGTTMTAINIK